MSSEEKKASFGTEELQAGLIVGVPGAVAATLLVAHLVNLRQGVAVGAVINMAGMTLIMVGCALKSRDKECSFEGVLTGMLVAWIVPLVVLAWSTSTPNLLWALIVLGVLLRGPVLRYPLRISERIKGAAWIRRLQRRKIQKSEPQQLP